MDFYNPVFQALFGLLVFYIGLKMFSDGMPKGDTLRIALTHTGMNLIMAIALLPFVHPIARFISRF